MGQFQTEPFDLSDRQFAIWEPGELPGRDELEVRGVVRAPLLLGAERVPPVGREGGGLAVRDAGALFVRDGGALRAFDGGAEAGRAFVPFVPGFDGGADLLWLLQNFLIAPRTPESGVVPFMYPSCLSAASFAL